MNVGIYARRRMTDCVFCQEIQESHPNVFYLSSDRLWTARWDNFPVRAGHVEIAPARHRERFSDLTGAELGTMMPFAREVMDVITNVMLDNLFNIYRHFQLHTSVSPISDALIARALEQAGSLTRRPDAWTFGMADGNAAGQDIAHLHMHIIPRWWDDISDPSGHIRHIFGDDILYQR
jgi:ATP adenylyltransferase